MRALGTGILMFSLLAFVAVDARADDRAAESGAVDAGDSESMRAQFARLAKEIGKRALRRSRRSLTLGPSFGVAPSIGLDSGDVDLQLSFGLALLRYEIPPLPTPQRILEIVKKRFFKGFSARIVAAVLAGEKPTPVDRERIAREVWEEIKAEFFLELRPQRWEKPSFALRLEAVNLTSANAWDVRMLAGLGFGPVFISTGPSIRYDDGFALVSPIELSKPMLLSDGLRSPVVEFFLRAELALTGRKDHEDTILLGARFMLDVI